MSEQHSSLQIADMMSNFLQSAPSGDKEILDTVAKYSLQILPHQHFILNRLFMASSHPMMPVAQGAMIRNFIEEYMQTKRFHDSLPFIAGTIDSLALKRFVQGQNIKGQVIK